MMKSCNNKSNLYIELSDLGERELEQGTIITTIVERSRSGLPLLYESLNGQSEKKLVTTETGDKPISIHTSAGLLKSIPIKNGYYYICLIENWLTKKLLTVFKVVNILDDYEIELEVVYCKMNESKYIGTSVNTEYMNYENSPKHLESAIKHAIFSIKFINTGICKDSPEYSKNTGVTNSISVACIESKDGTQNRVCLPELIDIIGECTNCHFVSIKDLRSKLSLVCHAVKADSISNIISDYQFKNNFKLLDKVFIVSAKSMFVMDDYIYIYNAIRLDIVTYYVDLEYYINHCLDTYRSLFIIV